MGKVSWRAFWVGTRTWPVGSICRGPGGARSTVYISSLGLHPGGPRRLAMNVEAQSGQVLDDGSIVSDWPGGEGRMAGAAAILGKRGQSQGEVWRLILLGGRAARFPLHFSDSFVDL